MQSKIQLFPFLQFIIFFLSFVTNWYEELVISLFFISVLMTLDKLGKGVVLREIIALHTCFICLVMPLIGYRIFNDNNALVRLWVKQMPVDEVAYYSYALPAVAGFALTLCWPFSNKSSNDNSHFVKQAIAKIRILLRRQPKTGLYLLVVGTVMFWVSAFLPVEIQFAFLLFYFASFTGFLYVYYTPNFRYKLLVLALFAGFILMNTFSSGMFTVVAYMGLTLFSFFFLGRKTRLWKKILWFFTGIFFLVILQLVKPAFRQITWKGNYTGSKAELFANMFGNQVSNFNWKSADVFFPVYVRTNQGFNVALVMRRIPTVKPHDNGNRLFLTLASSLVPRFLWPDKPEAGGRFNMEYYTGYIIKGWSTNVGPLGEAYGSFGIGRGIIFMILLGGFIRWAYGLVFKFSRKTPLIILWIPVLLYQVTYSAESDTMQIMNSLVKSAFFIWILYKIIPSWFGKSRTITNFKRQSQPAIYNQELSAR